MSVPAANASAFAYLPGMAAAGLNVPETGTQGPSWAFPAPDEDTQAGGRGSYLGSLTVGDNSPDQTDVPDNSPADRDARRELRARRAHQRAYERRCTAERMRNAGIVPKNCPHSRPVIHGKCAHGSTRWIAAPCGARECAYCGPRGRDAIALRIVAGVKAMWTKRQRVTWLVLTFPRDVGKKTAVRHLGHFMRWVRAVLKQRGIAVPVEYCATYELTQNGRLHINVLVSPWDYIAQRAMCDAWCREIQWEGFKGASVSVKAITGDPRHIGSELAKTQNNDVDNGSIGELGRYLSKFDQSVTEDRRVSFSRGWPKLDVVKPQREGEIAWDRASPHDVEMFETEKRLGEWVFCQGEYSRALHLPTAETCTCFNWARPSIQEQRGAMRRKFERSLLLHGLPSFPSTGPPPSGEVMQT